MPRRPLFIAMLLALLLAVGCSAPVPTLPPTATPIPPPTATPTPPPTATADSARATGRSAETAAATQTRVSPPHGTGRRVTVENGVVTVELIFGGGPTPTALERAIRSSGDTSSRRWDAPDCAELAGQLVKGHKYGYAGLGGIVQYTDTLGGFVLNAWTFLPDEWLRHCAWRDYTMPPARPGR